MSSRWRRPRTINDTAITTDSLIASGSVMNVLIIDIECQGLDLALRCGDAGNKVKLYRDSKKPIKDGKGFHQIQLIDDWRSAMAWAKNGLIVPTGNAKFTQELDRFRDLGFPIFGPTAQSARLEIDRAFGMETMKKVGIDLPPYEMFSSLDEAEKFARKADRVYVFKPLGDTDDKSLTYCPCDPADLVGFFQRLKEKGLKIKGACMLQEKIDMLVEFGVSGWMGPDGFLPGKWQICFEHKKLMNGEIGPNTGEMGTVCQYSKKDKLAEEMLKPIEPILKRMGHTGDFAVGCGVDKKGKAWPFEFTARAGWPARFIQDASHDGDPSQWMKNLLVGQDSLTVSEDVAIGVVMAQPKFPYNKSASEDVEGNVILGLEDVDEDQIHPIGVMVGKGPTMDGGKIVDGQTFQTTGEYVLCVTGLGSTIRKARKSVYGAVDKIKFANAMYRTDIGEKLEAPLPRLKEFGYAKGLEW